MSRDPKITSRIMAAVPNHNTVPELLLRRELHHRGLRYRVRSSLLGRPDLVFPRARTVVFVDGDYWHGNAWKLRGAPSFEAYYGRGNNAQFWLEKIRRNVDRDDRVTADLESDGWRVIRLWESDVRADLQTCANRVERYVRGEGQQPAEGPAS